MSEDKTISKQDSYDLHSISTFFNNLDSYLNTDKIKVYYKQYFGWTWPSAIIFYILKFLVFNVVIRTLKFWYNSLFRKFKWAKRISLFFYKIINYLAKKNNHATAPPPWKQNKNIYLLLLRHRRVCYFRIIILMYCLWRGKEKTKFHLYIIGKKVFFFFFFRAFVESGMVNLVFIFIFIIYIGNEYFFFCHHFCFMLQGDSAHVSMLFSSREYITYFTWSLFLTHVHMLLNSRDHYSQLTWTTRENRKKKKGPHTTLLRSSHFVVKLQSCQLKANAKVKKQKRKKKK